MSLQTKGTAPKDFHWHIIIVALLTFAVGGFDRLSGSNIIDPTLAGIIGGGLVALLKYAEGH